MLVLQQNYGKRYECTISTFEAGLGLDAAVVYIQKLFFGNQIISHLIFNFYWLFKIDSQKNMQVLIAIRKDILNGVIIDNQTDLVSHPYYTILNIKKFCLVSKKVLKKTKVINIYDNKVDKS